MSPDVSKDVSAWCCLQLPALSRIARPAMLARMAGQGSLPVLPLVAKQSCHSCQGQEASIATGQKTFPHQIQANNSSSRLVWHFDLFGDISIS